MLDIIRDNSLINQDSEVGIFDGYLNLRGVGQKIVLIRRFSLNSFNFGEVSFPQVNLLSDHRKVSVRIT